VVITYRRLEKVNNDLTAVPAESEEHQEWFDEVIFACDADSALKILQRERQETWWEKKVLGNVKYKWDVTITHGDIEYMKKVLETIIPLYPRLK
jgi:predicted NAD/FAD-binding protein